MDYQALRDEILEDPERLGYANKSDYEIHLLLNAHSFTKRKPISLNRVLIWAARNSIITKLEAGATNQNNTVVNICKAALILLQSGALAELDVTHNDNLQMIDALVTANVFQANDRMALLALGDQPASRADVLGFASASHEDVAKALRGGM
jgi:hypothetical protein